MSTAQWEFDRHFGDLSRYNGEKDRGILHSPHWIEKMRLAQQRFDAWQAVGSPRPIPPEFQNPMDLVPST